MAVAVLMNTLDLLREREQRLEETAADLKAQRDLVLDQLREVRNEIDREERAPLHVVPRRQGRQGKPVSARQLDAVMALVEQLGECSTLQIAEHLNITEGMARDRLRRLEELGNVARRGLRAQTRWVVSEGTDVPAAALAAVPSQGADYKARVRDIMIELGTCEVQDIVAAGVSYPTAKRWADWWVEHGGFERETIERKHVYAYVPPDPTPVNRVKRETPEEQMKGRKIGPDPCAVRQRPGWFDRMAPVMRDLVVELEAAGCTIASGRGSHLKVLWHGSYVGQVSVRSDPPKAAAIVDSARSQLRSNGVPI
jgi:DNA-binding Lrp family transcriptional regulator